MPVILCAIIFFAVVSGLHAEEKYLVLEECGGENLQEVDYANVLVRDDLDEFKRLEECGLPRELLIGNLPPPFAAAKYNSVKILEHILREWGVGIDEKSPSGQSLFITAAAAGSYSTALMLAEHGASTSSYDRYSSSVLRYIFSESYFLNEENERDWIRLLPYIDKSEQKQ